MNILDILFSDFFKSDSALVLAIIFVAKITEVTFSTLRIILVNKGQRNLGFVLALIEIFFWVIIAGNVITDIGEYPMKAVMYGLGFGCGVYLGSLIEGKLAIGNVLIQAIVPLDQGILIAGKLREAGFGVTSVDGRGRESERKILFVYAKRKSSKDATEIITSIEPDAMVIAHESNAITGGFNSHKQLFK